MFSTCITIVLDFIFRCFMCDGILDSKKVAFYCNLKQEVNGLIKYNI